MEAKKNPKLDLSKRRQLYQSIGLVITMIFVNVAFEWKTYDDVEIVALSNMKKDSFEEIVEIPPTEQPPPPPPSMRSVVLIEVPTEEEIIDNIEIDLDIDISEDTRIEEYIPDIQSDIEDEEVEEIFTIVESSPNPMGGYQAFYEELGERIKYPASARRMGIEGKVFLEFVVDKDGSLTSFRVVKGISDACDKEAIRVLKTMPKWTPGKQRGKTVKVKMVIPITYKLN